MRNQRNNNGLTVKEKKNKIKRKKKMNARKEPVYSSVDSSRKQVSPVPLIESRESRFNVPPKFEILIFILHTVEKKLLKER